MCLAITGPEPEHVVLANGSQQLLAVVARCMVVGDAFARSQMQ